MEAKPIEVIMRIDFAASSGTEICAHAEKVQELVRCKECKHRGTDDCPMYFEEQVEWEEDGGYIERDTICHDYTEDDGFCDRGERRE